MLEDLYGESGEIEEKYLSNFSVEEKVALYHQQQARKNALQDHETRLLSLIYKGAPVFFSSCNPEKKSALEIRYILNKIAANDPRDTTFALHRIDCVANADRLALQIAKAFQTNSVCQHVVLNNIGLTDKGMLPILSVLQNKELRMLDIGENKISDESFQAIETILSNPENKWHQVKLGRIKDPHWAEVFSKHSHLTFSFEDHSVLGTTGVIKHFFARARQK